MGNWLCPFFLHFWSLGSRVYTGKICNLNRSVYRVECRRDLHSYPHCSIYMSPHWLHGFSLVSYADNSQIVISVSKQSEAIAFNFHACMTQIMRWMSRNYLKINTDKTEVMEFGNGPSLWNPTWWPMELGQCPIPSNKVKNLWVIFDDSLILRARLIG